MINDEVAFSHSIKPSVVDMPRLLVEVTGLGYKFLDFKNWLAS